MTGLDERLRFFHRHAQQIREWASLESELNSLVDKTLSRRLEADRAGDIFNAQQLDPKARVLRPASGDTWPAVKLFRPTWLGGDGSQVCIALQWRRSEVTTDDLHAPVVGVWLKGDVPELRNVRADLRAATAGFREKHEHTSTAVWWPALRRLPARSEEHLQDLHCYVDWLIDETAATWNELGPAVDDVFAARETRS